MTFKRFTRRSQMVRSCDNGLLHLTPAASVIISLLHNDNHSHVTYVSTYQPPLGTDDCHQSVERLVQGQ